jgi:hypothetical protein
MASAQPANKAPVSGSATDRRARTPNMPVQASRSTPPPNPAEPTRPVAAVCWLDRTRCATRYESGRPPPASRGAVAPFPATKTSANAPLIAANRANWSCDLFPLVCPCYRSGGKARWIVRSIWSSSGHCRPAANCVQNGLAVYAPR